VIPVLQHWGKRNPHLDLPAGSRRNEAGGKADDKQIGTYSFVGDSFAAGGVLEYDVTAN
jgi:hypothetical protein